VWQRTDGDSVNIFSSYRSGTSWSAPIPVTHDANVENTTPRVAESQTRVLAVWERNNDICYSTYVSNSWQTPQSITSSAANDSLPEIAGSDFGNTAVCWQSDAPGNWEVYRTATDTLITNYRVTYDNSSDVTPCPLFYTIPVRQWDIPMIVFMSERNGNPDVFSWVDYLGTTVIDTNPAQDLYPVLTANLRVYVWALWQTDRDGDWDICGSYHYIQGSVEEKRADAVKDRYHYATIIASGTIPIPENSVYRIFDISGSEIHTLDPAPGIYFIVSEKRVTNKIIKIK
jgi:hypothetical protein